MKVGKPRIGRKALSPVMAVLLMLAVFIASGVVTYLWAMGLLGGLMGTGGTQTKEQIVVDAYKWNVSSNALILYLRNVGSVEVVLDAIYIDGVQVCSNMSRTLSATGTAVAVSVTSPGKYTPGATCTLKVATKSGAVFTFAVICGIRERATGVPRLEVSVMPPGFPSVGDSWEVRAYVTTETDMGTVHMPAKKAAIYMNVLDRNMISKTYIEYTDDKGLATFRRTGDFLRVSFQAFLDLDNSTLKTEPVLLTEEFIPSEPVRKLVDYSFFISLPLTLVGLIASRKGRTSPRSGRKFILWIFYSMVVTALIISAIVTFGSMRWFFYAATTWGYPRSMSGTYMNYDVVVTLFSLWTILFTSCLFLGLILIIEWKPPKGPADISKGYP